MLGKTDRESQPYDDLGDELTYECTDRRTNRESCQ